MVMQHGAKNQQPNVQKMRELILYLSSLSELDPHFGMTKLNKLLFYCDFTAYLNFGKSITGFDYQRWAWGPRPHNIDEVLKALQEDGVLAVEHRQRYNYPQNRAYALQDADLKLFDATEVDLINYIVKQFKDMNAKDISETSHDFLGWQLADEYETIPYSVARVRAEVELSEKDYLYAKNLVKDLHS
jgi:uncharacterized phage-associated protein